MQNKKQSILYFSIGRLFSRLHSSSGHEGNIRGVMQTRDLIQGLHRVKLVSAWLVVRICEANIELLIRSDERLMVETSVFDSFNGGHAITLLTCYRLQVTTPPGNAYLSCCWSCRLQSIEELELSWFLWCYLKHE